MRQMTESGKAENKQHFGRGLSDPAVVSALRAVPRHEFVPPESKAKAGEDVPLPIGHGQTISQPYIVGVMTETLEVGPDAVVLEVGTGSGYQAAVLASLVKRVYSVEIVEALALSARQRLKRLGYHNVEICRGDGAEGWPEHAPYDGIMVTAASPRIPDALVRQLKPGARLVMPVGPTHGVQYLTTVAKEPGTGAIRSRQGLAVRFVPLTG